MKEINLSVKTNSNTDAGFNIYEDDFELPVDMIKRGNKLIIKTPVVGATEEDINITINNDILFIYKKAFIEKEKIDHHYTKECYWGAIAREIHLPLSIDPIETKASLENGILKIVLPIIEKKKTKIIKIK